jgi:hypothetical protein
MNLSVLAISQCELLEPEQVQAALAQASQLITRLNEAPGNKAPLTC